MVETDGSVLITHGMNMIDNSIDYSSSIDSHQ